ncbi:hypothetical protein [Allomuricauda sp. R78024]|uniref:hypothetical protein n=1 Tax=Allomuricauda sp. R78024 TaxID=3093867 RepID=UPI0037C8198F
MKKRHVNLWGILFLITVASCSKDDGNEIEEPTKSNLKQITAFIFKSDSNTALAIDISASINETDKVISVTMSYGTDITALTPEITVSDKAEVNNSSNDFSGTVKVTITAEDGSTVTYDIVVTVESNNTNNILSLTFSNADNPIDVTIVGQIDEENKTILRLKHHLILIFLHCCHKFKLQKVQVIAQKSAKTLMNQWYTS